MTTPDGSVYIGQFQNGLATGLGVMMFADGSRYCILCNAQRDSVKSAPFFRYEGSFSEGWFHGPGAFWRSDGMRFEGEFRGGRIWGKGMFFLFDLLSVDLKL